MTAMTLEPGPAGHFRGTFEPKRSGSYEIVVKAQLNRATLTSEKVAVEVGRPNLEFDRLDLDDKMLSRIAAETGGRYLHISTADRLLEELGRQRKKEHVVLEQRALLAAAVLGVFRGLAGRRMGPAQEVSAAMSHATGYRFLEPAALARVKNLAMVARGVVEGFITGLHASPYKGFSVEFAEHRKYSPGDNPRHLDWRVLGRTDRLYIKQYEEETNLRCHILLDASGSMGYGLGQGVTKLQYGSYLTAVLAYLMLRQQDAVGLTTFDTKVRLEMPARSSPRHFDEMMHQLEAVRPGKTTDLGATLHRLADRFKRRCLIVLISDLYGDPEAVEQALHHLHHKRHEVIVFHVLDKAEIDFPFREVASFRRPGDRRAAPGRSRLRPGRLPAAGAGVHRALSPHVCRLPD